MIEEDNFSGAENVGAAFDWSPKTLVRVLNAGHEGNTCSSTLFAQGETETVAKLRDELERRNIFINGDNRLLALGGNAVVTHVANSKDGLPIDGIVGRVDYKCVPKHPTILQAALTVAPEEASPFIFRAVAYAPNVEGQPMQPEDMIRTLRVLKSSGSDMPLMWDIQKSAFAFLEDVDGSLIRYPNTEVIPDDYRGKPIAFIRDLNAFLEPRKDSVQRSKIPCNDQVLLII